MCVAVQLQLDYCGLFQINDLLDVIARGANLSTGAIGTADLLRAEFDFGYVGCCAK